MKFVRFSISILIGALIAVGCSSPAGEIKPPDIIYNEEVCEACGMLISDARFASATVDVDGTAHKFDDIGDLLSYYAKRSTAQVKAYFVHDFYSEQWLRAETAYYIVSPKILTPMARGIAAFADKGAAESAAQQYGVKVLTFDEVRSVKPMAMPMP